MSELIPKDPWDLTPSYPPCGFDRADGSILLDDKPIGTPTPDGAWIISPAVNMDTTPVLEELPTSPTIDRGEQATIVHQFMTDAATGENLILQYHRGVIVEDSNHNTFRVLNARSEYQRADRTLFTLTTESLTFDTPPAEFSIDIIEFNPALQKHPRYACLTRDQVQNVYALRDSYSLLNTADFSNLINFNVVPSSQPLKLQSQGGQELSIKLRKGIDSFYLPGFRVSFSTFNYAMDELNPGGYIEAPYPTVDDPHNQNLIDPATGLVFWSKDGTGDPGTNIFDTVATINPVLYHGGITWLRLADSYTYQRTWFRKTQTWIGAPKGYDVEYADDAEGSFQWKGHWDENIYSTVYPVNAFNTDPNQ